MLSDSKEEDSDWEDYYKDTDVTTMPWYFEELDHDIVNIIKSKNLKGGKFLDLGTGPGTQAMQLADLGFEVTGSDLSQSAIEKASKLFPKPNFVVDDILDSTLPENEFDFIFDRGIFHIFGKEKLPSYLNSIKRILKENGLLFLKCMSQDEKKISNGEGPTLYSQKEIKEFFENEFEIETIKNSLFYGATDEPYKAIFAVLKNSKSL